MTPGATGWVGVTEIQLTGVFDFFLTVIFHFSIIRIWGLVLPSIVDNFFWRTHKNHQKVLHYNTMDGLINAYQKAYFSNT